MPLFSTGMRLTPARLNFVQIARQSANQAVTNSTALVDSTGLSLTGVANTVYEVEAKLVYEAPVANDFKFGFTWPLGGSLPWGMTGLVSSAGGISGDLSPAAFATPATGAPFVAGGGGAGNQLLVLASGTWTVGATGGLLKVQFAQGTAGAATSAILVAGSTLKITRIG